MFEYLRFGLFALLMAGGLIVQLTAVLGIGKFRYSINRIHAAGMVDSLGVLLFFAAAFVYTGWDDKTLKIIAILAFLWLTSPVSGHLLGRLVSETDEHFKAEAELWNR